MAGGMAKHVPDSIDPLTDSVVIDTDVHLTYNATLRKEVAKYMDEPYRSYVHPDTADSYPATGWTKSLGGKRKFHVIDVNDPEDIYEPLCEGLGVDYPIINTSAPLDKVIQTEHAVAEMRAVNNMLLDRFLDDYDEFYGLASVAMREPNKAAEEIDRIGDEDSIVGVYLYQGEYQKPLGDPSHDMIYRALEDNDLTPTYHISGMDRKAQVLREMEKNIEWHALGPVWGGMMAVTSLIAQGVPEKFPDLDFVSLEGDFTWVPMMMARMNREYAQWKSELPLLEKTPEEYIRESFYFGTQPIGEFADFSHMVDLINIVGPESLVFATDHPHYDFDVPNALDKFLKQLEDQEREQVLHRNAADVYGLNV